MSVLRRLGNLLRAQRYERNLDSELAFHIQETADELERMGMRRADAEREARRRFGNRTGIAERTRDMDILGRLDSVLRDIRYAIRSLARSPGFALVAIVSLALGIGANTAIFTLLNALVLRSLPVESPHELITLRAGGSAVFTYPLWEQLRDRDLFDGTYAFQSTDMDLTTGGVVRRVPGNWVSGDFFRVLGVHAIAGRVLQRSDDVPGCPPVAVVGEAFAQREFGGTAAAVGRPLTLDGVPFTVVGVVPRGFEGVTVGRGSDVYGPLCVIPAVVGRPDYLAHRSAWYLRVMARLPDTMSLEAATGQLAAVSPGIFEATVPPNSAAQGRERYLARVITARSTAAGPSEMRQDFGGPLTLLMIVVGVVLLIACINVANLLLARGAAREREMAIRLAVGAGRSRLVRQLLTESVILASLGALIGVVFAHWASRALVGWLSFRGDVVTLDLSPDLRVLGFTVAVALVTGLLFGMVPAFRATRVDPQSAMKADGRSTSGRAQLALGRVLVSGQVALSLLLLIVAGLLLRSFHRLATVDPGFRRDGVLVAKVDYGKTDFDSTRSRMETFRLLEQLRVMPGVAEAGASQITPLSGSGWNDRIIVEGFVPRSEQDDVVWFNGISESFLATMGTELIAGRGFTASDDRGTTPVALVNESLARKFFAGRSAIGGSYRIRRGDQELPPVTIVGVVRDARYAQLNEDNSEAVYLPLRQTDWWGSGMNFVLRGTGDPAALAPAVTEAAAAISRSIALEYVLLADQVADTIAREKLLALLSGFFGLLASALAVIGLYGTIAYGVARRRAEIGVRLALGARQSRLVRMILGEAGVVVAFGLMLGAMGAFAFTRILRGILYGITPTDPITIAAAASLLALSALAAAAIPALRASRLDPMTTLREE